MSACRERVPVEANTCHLAAGESGTQAAEGPVVLVDNGHAVPGINQGVGQRDAHAPATHDHKMRHMCLLKRLSHVAA